MEQGEQPGGSVMPEKGRIVAVSLAHLINDWYMNYIQTLLPFLVAAGLPVSRGAFLVSIFTVTSSIVQPFAGYFADRKYQRWPVYAGTLWMSVLLCPVGVLKDYTLLMVCVCLAGLGTAAFHPQASAIVTAVSGRRKGFFQAFFITFGNFGWALTPLTAVPFIERFGMQSTTIFALPGILAAILLFQVAPRVPAKPARLPMAHLWNSVRSVWSELTKVVLVVAFRSLAAYGLITFLPLYLRHKNIPLVQGSRMLGFMLLIGALGGLLGGYLSDRLGRKPVIVASLVLASPLYHLYLGAADGPAAYFLLAVAGVCLPASYSVTVVVAQEILPRNAAMSAGLMLGFGIGIGGLGVGLLGLFVEHAGIGPAMYLIAWLPLLAGLIGLSLENSGRS